MTAIKICGITRIEDALICVEVGIDAIGFIFYAPSPRYVSPPQVREIGAAIRQVVIPPPYQTTIFSSPHHPALCGVFVDEEVERVKEIMDYCGLDFIQLHGNESADYVKLLPAEWVIKSFPLRTRSDLEVLNDYRVRAVLVDAYDPRMPGGTGKTADWELAREVKRVFPLILSGGLNTDNVGAALRSVSPAAVDINSGVECAPGIKDTRKIEEIVATVRRTSHEDPG